MMKPPWAPVEVCRLCIEAYEDEEFCVATLTPCSSCEHSPYVFSESTNKCTQAEMVEHGLMADLSDSGFCKDYKPARCRLRTPIYQGNIADTSNIDPWGF